MKQLDFPTFSTLMMASGLPLTEAQLHAIHDGAGPLLGMLERINRPLPREAEPMLTFDPENV